ncbi:hypothetical protein AB0I81_55675 [Nonomuraea sp. NPDC050404]|uniref:hypothetical protein n=1 Tax=Nonomuraea sp. NPDC050404 TaxID=3155783 RepID=UPI0033E12F8E
MLAQSGSVDASSRGLIHDAIRACSADGELHPAELGRIRAMNRLLGHPENLVDEWIAYHRQEEAIRLRRATMIWPDPADKPY